MSYRESDAVVSVLRWLIGGGHPATVDSLYRYYTRHLTRSWGGAYEHGFRGAATRMLNRLEREGYVGNGGVTRAGKRMAQ